MANLVTPVNMLPPTENRVIDFKGLNRQHTVAEGEMSDMLNLTSDDYPILTQRKPRGTMSLPAGVLRPLRLMSKFERIAMIARTDEDIVFYYDGELINAVNDLSESTTMVAINTKICFFPEKTYLEIAPDGTPGTYGSLEATADLTSIAVTVSAADERITLSADHGFKYDDAVTINGVLQYTASGTSKSADVDISCPIEQIVNDNTIVLPQGTLLGLLDAGATSISFASGSISRTMPDLDVVAEWNNRLWGASSADNTIYASKLGDPTNWQYFQGTSLDSYSASQGTDGAWTGIAKYSNHLIVFKQESMSRIFGTAPSNFQVTNSEIFGVESGSRQSVITINDTVFYKSKIGIMAYSGSTPVCISDNLNTEFRDVVAGTEKRKYYASMHKKAGGYELMVFDTEKGLWHKEDSTRFRSTATIDDKLYYIVYHDELLNCSEHLYCSEWLLVGSENTSGSVGIINPQNATEDAEQIHWTAVFGPFDEYIEEHKIYSKLALRVATDDPNGWIKVYISLNDGEWEQVELYEPPTTKGDFIPIVPRRCDRYSVKIEGQGKCEIRSMTRRVRRGSFGRI